MIKEKLQKARVNRGLSQEKLADMIGMSQPNYSKKENGEKTITDAEWNRLAKELKVDVEDIKEVITPNVVCKTFKGNNFSFNFGTIHNNIPEAMIEFLNEFFKTNSKKD